MQWWRDQLCRCAGKVPDWCSGSLLRGLSGPNRGFLLCLALMPKSSFRGSAIRASVSSMSFRASLSLFAVLVLCFGLGGVGGGEGGGTVLKESSRLLQ